MKKIALLLAIIFGLFSCDTADLSNYDINYNKENDIITINGIQYDNIENDYILNDIGIRPYVEDNSILLTSNEEIFSIRINTDVKYRLKYMSKSAYMIIFLEENWLSENDNIDITLTTTTD